MPSLIKEAAFSVTVFLQLFTVTFHCFCFPYYILYDIITSKLPFSYTDSWASSIKSKRAIWQNRKLCWVIAQITKPIQKFSKVLFKSNLKFRTINFSYRTYVHAIRLNITSFFFVQCILLLIFISQTLYLNLKFRSRSAEYLWRRNNVVISLG